MELELKLEQNGEIKKFSDVLTVQMPKEKRPNELMIIIPEANKDNVVIKLQDSFGFTVSLQTLLGQEPVKGKVNMISDIYFQYSIGKKISVASKEHVLEVDGQLSLTVLPSRNWQKITFFLEGGEPRTFQFREKK